MHTPLQAQKGSIFDVSGLLPGAYRIAAGRDASYMLAVQRPEARFANCSWAHLSASQKKALDKVWKPPPPLPRAYSLGHAACTHTRLLQYKLATPHKLASALSLHSKTCDFTAFFSGKRIYRV